MKSRRSFPMCAAAFLLLFFPAGTAAAAGEPVAKVSGVKGSLELLRGAKPGAGWSAVKTGDPGYLEDRLRTDANSVAALQFVVGGTIGIDRSSEIRLVGERAAEDVRTGRLARIALEAGSIWARFAKQSEEVRIQTQGGVLGIEGTEFVVEEAPGASTSVSVLEGAVVYETPGGEFHVKEGEELVVPFQEVPVVRAHGAEALRKRVQERHSTLWGSFFSQVAREVLHHAAPEAVPFADLGLSIVDNPNAAAKELAADAADRAGGGGLFGSVIRKIPTGKKKKEPDFIAGLDPSEGTVDNLAPSFQWDPFPGASSYWFVLGDYIEAGSRMTRCIRKEQTSGTTLSWPEDAPRLEPGRKYTWQVIAVDASGKPASKWSQTSFTVSRRAAAP